MYVQLQQKSCWFFYLWKEIIEIDRNYKISFLLLFLLLLLLQFFLFISIESTFSRFWKKKVSYTHLSEYTDGLNFWHLRRIVYSEIDSERERERERTREVEEKLFSGTQKIKNEI